MTDRPQGAVPSVAEVVAEMWRILDEPGSPRPDGLVGQLAALHETNAAQWALEDQARADISDDSAVAAVKRAIDGLNVRRHHYMEVVDEEMRPLVESAPSAPPSIESPAMAFDRLSVLVIRLHHTERAARSSSDATEDLRQRLPMLRTQLATLEQAIEVLLAELAAGTRRYEPYRSYKLYGS